LASVLGVFSETIKVELLSAGTNAKAEKLIKTQNNRIEKKLYSFN